MKLFVTSAFSLLTILVFSNTERIVAKQEYIQQWHSIAVEQMIEYKIPASITLAQAILESGTGTSPLATKGNNHFGIKCHGWQGEKMYHDDDAKGECFRVYPAADYSFFDHSEFLTSRPRYSDLFTLEITDYKGWAKGLKKAGYATNPQYPQLLIGLIEEFNLAQYDEIALPNKNAIKPKLTSDADKTTTSRHAVLLKNDKSKFIIAKPGDTYYRISEEFQMSMWELRKYNDFPYNKDVLEPGDYVYLQPKRSKGQLADNYFSIRQSETLYSISQSEGIKLTSLTRMNPQLSALDTLEIGTKVRLR